MDNTSTLKNSNFSEMSKDQIIEKYEMVLANRENQISYLSLALGNLNDKLMQVIKLINALGYGFKPNL